MASKYERELRYLLSGKRDVVEKLVNRVERTDPRGARRYRRILDNPFFVLRSAGSLGIDLVALRGEIAFPIEVKTSNEDVVRLSRTRRAKEQAEELTDTCLEAGLVPLYAYRHRDRREGDPWRMFLLRTDELDEQLDKRHGLLYKAMHRATADADVTDAGNYVLRWDEGWPLFEFVHYVTRLITGRRPRAAGTDPG